MRGSVAYPHLLSVDAALVLLSNDYPWHRPRAAARRLHGFGNCRPAQLPGSIAQRGQVHVPQPTPGSGSGSSATAPLPAVQLIRPRVSARPGGS